MNKTNWNILSLHKERENKEGISPRQRPMRRQGYRKQQEQIVKKMKERTKAIKKRKNEPATKVENFETSNRTEWILTGKFSLHKQPK